MEGGEFERGWGGEEIEWEVGVESACCVVGEE